MALTAVQREILKLLAQLRKERGESYVAGGVALNTLLNAGRKSRDIDLFHDTDSAVAETWRADRGLLSKSGFEVIPLREAPSFVEARVAGAGGRTIMQWARESAFRFFPLIEDERLGLALHPFDLATNKVLTLACRLEARDWLDVLACVERLQPLGYLVWAACGKDPGYNPHSLLAALGRVRFSRLELDMLELDGPRPDARALGERWHEAMDRARRIASILPPAAVGTCVLNSSGDLFTGSPDEAANAARHGLLRFHAGTIGGAWPTFRPE